MPAVPKPKRKRRKPFLRNRNSFNQRTRKRIKERDKNCLECGGEGEEIHHVYLKSQGGRGVYENGMLVCHLCHRRLHDNPERMKRWQRFFAQLYGSDYYKDEYDKVDAVWQFNKAK